MGLMALPLSISLVPSSTIGVTLALLAITAVAVYLYATRNYNYWSRKGIPYLTPIPFAGNLKDVVLFRKHIGHVLQEVYTKIKGQRYIGMYLFDQPVLLVRDTSLWKNVLHKDFEHFSDRGFSIPNSDTLFHETLFSRKGKYWKDLRTKLSPAFTSGKLKRFFLLLEQKAEHLDKYFDDAVREGTSRDVTDACGKYTTDAVATVGFGIETSALTDEDDHLRRVLKNVFVYNKIYFLLSLAAFVDLPLLKVLRVSFVPPQLALFLRSAIWSVAGERERTGSRGLHGDFLDLLLELREKGNITGDEEASVNGIASNGVPKMSSNMTSKSVNNGATNEFQSSITPRSAVGMDGDILISQSFSFLSAGHDTTATTMSFALYELAKNQSVQEDLRMHIKASKEEHGGKLTYDAIQSCSYLDMVLSETLRMYPILPFLDRVCTKTYRIPGSDLVIDKGTFLFTSILGIQRDPDLYPNPNTFDPQRFSEENKSSLPSGAYFPFGDGPRICIGMRLALVQAKLGLAHIILNYRLHPCAETPNTMEFNLHSFLIQPRNGVPLKFTRV